MTKYIYGGVIIAVVLGAAYYFGVGFERAPQAENTQTGVPAQNVTYEWRFTEAGEKDGVPQTKLALIVNGSSREIGTYAGTCFDMKGSAWKMDSNELAGAICWFGGGGNEIAVYNENGTISVKEGVVDEGDGETAGYRGDFVTLFELN